MADHVSVATALEARAAERAAGQPPSIPWTIWCLAAGVTSGMIGGIWDISWHMSIGRDTFWTAAHVAIYMNGVLAGIASGYLILATTLRGSQAAREASVSMWGFHGPLGAFIAAWGGIAMLTSAPFDNWWHNAYGLDVTILSPPHVLLSAGSLAIRIGTLTLIASLINRTAELRPKLTWIFLFIGATGVALGKVIVTELTWTGLMHSAKFYLAVAIAIPIPLFATAWGSMRRWAFTWVAGIYTSLMLGFEWILPLFPAQPKLGPVYQHITHFVPLGFPLLLIVPAIALDLLWNRDAASGLGAASAPSETSLPWADREEWQATRRKLWWMALLSGPVFVLSFLAAQWPFAGFLMTPASRNWVFGTQYFAYFDQAGITYNPYHFYPVEHTRAQFGLTMALALPAAILAARAGLWFGDWLRRMQR